MKIVIAPNALKGSLSGSEAASAIATGVIRAYPDAEIVKVPVADGGDGLLDVAIEALDGEIHELTVADPRQRPIASRFGHVAAMRFAAVEMALASGLALLKDNERNPLATTSLGTGELIKAALDLDVDRIGIGIGGSATNDGGMGVAHALGARFLDQTGNSLEPIGANLQNVRTIDVSNLDPRLRNKTIEAVCDVDNILCGPDGAAAVYGPQKGGTPEMIEQLDAGLANFADVLARDLGQDVRDLPGAGAAGGLGAGLKAILGAELRPGVDLVLDLVGLEAKLEGADLAITAEGVIDFQTAHGKAPAGVARLAKAQGIPCVALAGGIGERTENLHAIGVNAVFSLCPGPISLDQAIAHADSYLAAIAEQSTRLYIAANQRN